jgi:hypothetical protein
MPTKEMTDEQVGGRLRCYLELDSDYKIDQHTKLSDMGVQPIDLLAIMFEIGIEAGEYTSGERLNDRYRGNIRALIEERMEAGSTRDELSDLCNISECRTTTELVEKITFGALLDFQKYVAAH